ncbi:MAG: hypothetical protein K2M54_00160 [Muribaculaceae bacterium]|nr:hypothetical protein [Muribaculaceae bacterium]
MRSLIYIIVAFLVVGCGLSSRQPRVLDEASLLMHSDPESALSKLNSVDVSAFDDSATMARWALLYSEALVINRLSAPTDTIVNIAIDYYGRHRMTEDFQKATLLKSLLSSLDNSDPLASAIYLQKEKEFLLYKEKSKRELYMAVSVIALLIALAVILWMRQRIRLKSLQADALVAEASGLKMQIEVSRCDVSRLESKLHGLLDDRFTLIDSLCQTYYETQGTKAERKAIVDRVKAEIDSIKADSFTNMEQTVNDCRDNILVRVKEYYPDIKSDDFQLMVYLAGGLSTRTISLLLGESVDVIYKRKSRLKSRLKSRVEPYCPDIMDIF